MTERLSKDADVVRAKHPVVKLPQEIALGAVLGIATGIVFGERAAVLRPFGDAYGAMLQIAVFPYLLSSLMYSLGRLNPAMAQRLLRAGWAPFVFLWILTFAVISVLAYAIPSAPPPFSLTPSALHDQSNLLELLVPSNPFAALRNNYVPAVVIFAIIYGIAFQGVAKTQTLLDTFDAIKVASVKIWGWIVKLAPFGVFALLADTAGTVRLDQLAGLAFYVVTYLTGAAILGLLIVPALLAALTPVSYREILRQIRPALVLAVATTLSVAALPFVQRAAETILDRSDCPDSEERANVLQTSLSLSYVFAQLGNYFVYLLILYTTYVAAAPLRLAEKAALPLMTLLSCLGSPSATYDSVVFLSKWLHLPASVFDLYVETSAITRFAQVLASVAGFYFITLLVPLLYFKKLRLRPSRFVAALGGAAVLCSSLAFAGVLFRQKLFPEGTSPYAALKLDPRLTAGVKQSTRPMDDLDSNVSGPDSVPSIANIRKRGVLRVGFNEHAIPFSFRNAQGDLVGFDISYAYRLAGDLGVAIEFVPFTAPALVHDLTAHRFDIAMSGIYENDQRLQALTLSSPYYQSPVALIVPSKGAARFLDGNAVIAHPGLKLAVYEDSVLVPLSRSLFPNAQLAVVPDYSGLPGIMSRVDGAMWTLEQGTAWAAEHTGFTAVAPDGLAGPIPSAYAMAPDAMELGAYLNQWLQLRNEDGFRAEQIAYWMHLGRRPIKEPRWNLLDVLLKRH